MYEQPEIARLTDCEYEDIDPDVAPCHNPASHLDRANGIAVCVAHVESLELFIKERIKAAEERFAALKSDLEKEAAKTLHKVENLLVKKDDANDSDHRTGPEIVPGA